MSSWFDLTSLSVSGAFVCRFGERNLCWLSKLFLFLWTFRYVRWYCLEIGGRKSERINFKINFELRCFFLGDENWSWMHWWKSCSFAWKAFLIVASVHLIPPLSCNWKTTYKFLFEARHAVIIPDVLIPLPSSVPLGFSSHEMMRELRPLCKLCCSDDCLWWWWTGGWCCRWAAHSHDTFGMFKLCDATLRLDVGM